MQSLAEAFAVAAIVGLATHANAVEMPKPLIGEWCGNVGRNKVTTFYTKDLLRLLPGTCERSLTVTKGGFGWEDATCVPLAVHKQPVGPKDTTWVVTARCKDDDEGVPAQVKTYKFHDNKGLLWLE
jgi:hypothetical protein